MNLMSPRRSPAVLAWLQLILLERFGHTFSLRTIGQDTIQMGRVNDSSCIIMSADDVAYSRADSNLPFTTWNAAAEGWQSALGKSLPAPGAANLPSPLIEQTDAGYCIHYDILGLTYWMLSRQEEVGRTDLDNHGRFPATSSHAFKHGYLERPVVDEWLHLLGQVIQRLWPDLRLKQHKFSMKLSHDVDEPSRYGFRTAKGIALGMAGHVVKRRDLKSALQVPWIRLNSRTTLNPADPVNTFDWIMDASERHGLVSAFYFICGRTDKSKDADYEPEHPAIRELMRRIHARGHEVGLHPSYNSYQNPRVIIAEALRLRRVCEEEGISQPEWGGRMHFLRWEHPKTLQAWDDAGMTYDSTLSYADRPGFRCGTCFEYTAFNPVSGKPLNLRVRPLIAMECTVMAPRYMGLGTGVAALEKLIEFKNICKAVNGCFTLLWHNSNLESLAERCLYKAVLAG